MILMCLYSLIVLSVTSLWAQSLEFGNLTITDDKIREIEAQLPKLEADKDFYHWTNRASGIRWISQGHVNHGEMRFLNTPTGELQAYGPGLYLASEGKSSIAFGEVPVNFRISKGTPVYDEKIIRQALGRDLEVNEMALLGERIPFVRQVTEDGWHVTNSALNTQRVQYAGKIDNEARVYANNPKGWGPLEINKIFQETVQNGNQSAHYLKNILEASYYMDGISFARAMIVSPGAPWNEFEAEHFQKYQNTLKFLSENINKMGESFYKAEGFEKLDDLLLDINNRTSGSYASSLKDKFRVEGIRAGGTEHGQNFQVSDYELKILQANPYLEVVATKSNTTGHHVHYFYPDAFHYQKLKGILSEDLYNELSQQNAGNLMQDHQKRNALNKRIISELYEDFKKRMIKGEAKWSELVSIHPFSDMNGRTIRLAETVISDEPKHYFVGDFDLTSSPADELSSVTRGTLAHRKLQIALLDEYLLAISEKRMPDYLKTGAIQAYVNEAGPVLMELDIRNKDNLDLIKNRDWGDLFQRSQDNFLFSLVQKVDTQKMSKKDYENIKILSKSGSLERYTFELRKQLAEKLSKILGRIDFVDNPSLVGTPFETKTDEFLDLLRFYNNLSGANDIKNLKNLLSLDAVKLELFNKIKDGLLLNNLKEKDIRPLANLINTLETPLETVKALGKLISPTNTLKLNETIIASALELIPTPDLDLNNPMSLDVVKDNMDALKHLTPLTLFPDQQDYIDLSFFETANHKYTRYIMSDLSSGGQFGGFDDTISDDVFKILENKLTEIIKQSSRPGIGLSTLSIQTMTNTTMMANSKKPLDFNSKLATALLNEIKKFDIVDDPLFRKMIIPPSLAEKFRLGLTDIYRNLLMQYRTSSFDYSRGSKQNAMDDIIQSNIRSLKKLTTTKPLDSEAFEFISTNILDFTDDPDIFLNLISSDLETETNQKLFSKSTAKLVVEKFQELNPEKQKKLLTSVRLALKKSLETNLSNEMKSTLDLYGKYLPDLAPELKSQFPSVDDLTEEIKTWASRKSKMDDCLKMNLLQILKTDIRIPPYSSN